MPELPEVEVIKNSLNRYLQGQVLEDIKFKRTDIIGTKENSVPYSDFFGKTVESVSRHGKYILFNFSDDLLLIVHLRMTGKLIYLPSLKLEAQAESTGHKHSHARLIFSSGDLIYNDVRRFGKLYFSRVTDKTNLYDVLNVGPDALSEEFSPEYFFTRLQRHPKQPIKNTLLNQKVVAGIGNIYADEALFDASILPTRAAASLSFEKTSKLHSDIIKILESSIENGGTTFNDYRNAENESGTNQNKLKVYSRTGLPCVNCGQELESIRLGGRTTVYCSNCQK